MDKLIVYTEKAPNPVGPYSQAVKTGNLLFISGQIPIDPQTNALVTESFSKQCRQVLENLKAVILAGGSNLEKVVKVNIYLKDMNNFKELNDIYQEYFGTSKPARACVEVSRLPKDVAVEMEAIALC